ncbi:MAG TPA: F0F1 ATP synthase subunit delta [Alphaproteobacteria bacterium]|nr:F0F1 ATP synthase subunit delta [Alphaproteobacteria bacterium]
MQIDWVTVAAQIVNFLVLVWLLQRLLYGPIIRAMQRREERIANRLEEARQKRQEAEREAETYREKQHELDQRRDEVLSEAQEKASDLRKRLEQEARDNAKELRETWRSEVADEREEFLSDLRSRTAHHIYDVARSVLVDLADAELEGRAASRFVEHLKELDEDRIARMANAIEESGEPIQVESAFALAPAAKSQITRAAHEVFSTDAQVNYSQSEELLLGIRLSAGGQVIEWSLARYLEDLESNVREQLSQVRPAPKQEAA